MNAGTLYSLGLVLVFVGVLIMVIGTLLILLLRGRREGESRGGGAIIIGPVPIVFGTDKESLKTVLLLAITLTMLLAILTVIMYFMSK